MGKCHFLAVNIVVGLFFVFKHVRATGERGHFLAANIGGLFGGILCKLGVVTVGCYHGS